MTMTNYDICKLAMLIRRINRDETIKAHVGTNDESARLAALLNNVDEAGLALALELANSSLHISPEVTTQCAISIDQILNARNIYLKAAGGRHHVHLYLQGGYHYRPDARGYRQATGNSKDHNRSDEMFHFLISHDHSQYLKLQINIGRLYRQPQELTPKEQELCYYTLLLQAVECRQINRSKIGNSFSAYCAHLSDSGRGTLPLSVAFKHFVQGNPALVNSLNIPKAQVQLTTRKFLKNSREFVSLQAAAAAAATGSNMSASSSTANPNPNAYQILMLAYSLSDRIKAGASHNEISEDLQQLTHNLSPDELSRAIEIADLIKSGAIILKKGRGVNSDFIVNLPHKGAKYKLYVKNKGQLEIRHGDERFKTMSSNGLIRASTKKTKNPVNQQMFVQNDETEQLYPLYQKLTVGINRDVNTNLNTLLKGAIKVENETAFIQQRADERKSEIQHISEHHSASTAKQAILCTRSLEETGRVVAKAEHLYQLADGTAEQKRVVLQYHRARLDSVQIEIDALEKRLAELRATSNYTKPFSKNSHFTMEEAKKHLRHLSFQMNELQDAYRECKERLASARTRAARISAELHEHAEPQLAAAENDLADKKSALSALRTHQTNTKSTYAQLLEVLEMESSNDALVAAAPSGETVPLTTTMVTTTTGAPPITTSAAATIVTTTTGAPSITTTTAAAQGLGDQTGPTSVDQCRTDAPSIGVRCV